MKPIQINLLNCAAKTASLTVILTTFAFGAAAHSALAAPKSGAYEEVETIASPRLTVKSSTLITFKGSKCRIEATGAQDFVPYVNIVDGQSLYHFVPLAKEAVRNDLPKTYVTPIADLQEKAQRIEQQATKSGETVVGDANCDIYTMTFSDGSKGTFYLDKDPKFPYFIKEVMVHSDVQVVDTTTLEDIKLDTPVLDSEFTLPTGTKIDQAPPPSAQPGAGAGAPATGTPPAPANPAAPSAAPDGTTGATGGG